jgi:hypothetical protein
MGKLKIKLTYYTSLEFDFLITHEIIVEIIKESKIYLANRIAAYLKSWINLISLKMKAAGLCKTLK